MNRNSSNNNIGSGSVRLELKVQRTEQNKMDRIDFEDRRKTYFPSMDSILALLYLLSCNFNFICWNAAFSSSDFSSNCELKLVQLTSAHRSASHHLQWFMLKSRSVCMEALSTKEMCPNMYKNVINKSEKLKQRLLRVKPFPSTEKTHSFSNANETKCIYHNQFDCIYVKNLVLVFRSSGAA